MSYDGMPAAYHIDLPDRVDQQNDIRSQYDADIHHIVETFNRYLRKKYPESHYQDLDWRVIKAMIWVESGHKRSAWRFRPMQIGNIGDPGLKAVLYLKKTRLKNGKVHIQSEGAELIIPPDYAKNLTWKNKEKIRYDPQLNIQAGVAYLLMRHAKFGYKTVTDLDTKKYTVTVKLGDSINKIAVSNHTTVNILKQLNPNLTKHNLQIGSQLRYKKAIIQRTVIGWYPMNFKSITKKYNVKGDRRYRQKLIYAFTEINSK